ncbi:MAG: radical SAM protein [Crenarchaeota archaeon]|nr:radical SAM protein [Thermoproteota archaeon]
MRVLLALPPEVHDLEIYRVAGMTAPPLGLAYIAAVLERAGHKVAIVDSPTLRMTRDRFLQIVREFKPDIVGISLQTPLAPKGYAIAKELRREFPDLVLIAGGPHATYMVDEALDNGFDVVVRFEGEYTTLELVETIEKFGLSEEALKKVKGIAFRDREGRTIETPRREFIQNLDELPFPARHLLPMDRYRVLGKNIRAAHVMASRGCPYGCIFCSTSYFWGRRIRIRSAKNVADEVEQLVERYGAKYVIFTDDELTGYRRFVYDLVKEFRERKLDVVFTCGARVDHMDREFMKFLIDSGCVGLYFGVESGTQRTLDMIGKRITLEQARKVFQWAKELNAFAVASFVIGFPWETVEDVRKTIEFSIELDPAYAQFTVATPYPGTPLFHYALQHNLIEDWNWEHYTTVRPVMRGFYLDLRTIARLLQEAYTRFYARWSFMVRELKAGRLLQLIPRILRAVASRVLDVIRSRV